MASRSFSLFELSFTTPLHLGDARDDYSTSLKSISSDAMLSAIIATLAKMKGGIVPNNGDIGCVISDLFPFCHQKDANDIFFFPKPLSLASIPISDPLMMKKIKKTQWVDSCCLERLLCGEAIDYKGSVHGTYLTSSDFEEDFMVSSVTERVSVPRDGGNAVPYYMDRVFFKNGSGLFFLAEGDTSLVERALPLLCLEGIGTDRNVGNGRFTYNKRPFSLVVPDSSEYTYFLSSYIPDNKSVFGNAVAAEDSAYTIKRIGGWITTVPHLGLRKNAIYSLCSGSVIGKIDSGTGSIVDLTPAGLEITHPIWRNGRALTLPISQC